MSGKNDGLVKALSKLQGEKRDVDRQHEARQAEDLAKLLPIKLEHERTLKAIEEKLNQLAKSQPDILKISQHWRYRSPSAYGLFSYRASGKELSPHFRLDYNLQVAIQQPPRNTLWQKIVNLQGTLRVVLLPTAAAMAKSSKRTHTWGWRMNAPLGELVLDPASDVQDPENVRARLHESQAECLEQVKELLDDQKLAQAVFHFLQQYS